MEQKFNSFISILIVSIIISAAGCTSQQPQPEPASPGSDRLLGIGLTEGSVGFGESFRIAQDIGIQVVELPLAWDDIETSPGSYGNEYLEIANMFYPANNIRVSLSINPIDTNNLRLPKDLKGRDLDDPEVIQRYKNLIDYVFAQVPDLDLVSINIGNEIDAYMGDDKQKWDQYRRFFLETSEYVRNKKPGTRVGTKIQFSGALGKEAIAINRYSDIVMVTYYPLNPDFSVKEPKVVLSDLDELAAAYSDKILYLSEVGYPSSPFLGSSEEKQSEFIIEMFRAWDTHSDQIKLVNFIWLHDISGSEVTAYTDYYGFSSRGFSEFLGTLGLRTYDGSDKLAISTLKKEASTRGW